MAQGLGYILALVGTACIAQGMTTVASRVSAAEARDRRLLEETKTKRA